MACDPDFLNLAVPGVRGLRPYQPGKPVEALEREYGVSDSLKLASNESPLGPGPMALAAARDALGELGRYPDGGGFRLKAALSAHHDIDSASITLGNGSNDLLDLLARVFLGPGSNAVFSAHAFAVYALVTQAVGARSIVVPAHNGANGPAYGHDLGAMLRAVDADTRLVFVANPNNPTGTWLSAAELEAFLEAVPERVVVVVDEAYFEYVDAEGYGDCTAWLERFSNLVVTRTFSKIHGLAALRVGYSLSHPQVADLLNRVRQPFNVNSVALAAAEAALQDKEHICASLEVNRAGLAQLAKGLGAIGVSWIPSVGNFLSVNVGPRAAEVYEALLRRGVIVRPVANYGLSEFQRITVGTRQENARLLQVLGAVVGSMKCL